jgi:hypothetical protein
MTTLDEHPKSYGLPAVPALTMLDGLLSDLAEHPAISDTVEFDIKARPGWSIVLSTDIPYEHLAACRKAALDPSLVNGTNEVQLGCSILVYACRGLRKDGEPVTSAGEPVTLSSPALLKMLDATRPADATRKLFVRDGHITGLSTQLLLEAGYGSEATPTRR